MSYKFVPTCPPVISFEPPKGKGDVIAAKLESVKFPNFEGWGFKGHLGVRMPEEGESLVHAFAHGSVILHINPDVPSETLNFWYKPDLSFMVRRKPRSESPAVAAIMLISSDVLNTTTKMKTELIPPAATHWMINKTLTHGSEQNIVVPQTLEPGQYWYFFMLQLKVIAEHVPYAEGEAEIDVRNVSFLIAP